MTGPPSEAPDQHGPGRDEGAEDDVDEASEESFPASDAPQRWAGPEDR